MSNEFEVAELRDVVSELEREFDQCQPCWPTTVFSQGSLLERKVYCCSKFVKADAERSMSGLKAGSQGGGLFAGVRFVLAGFDPAYENQFLEELEENGGFNVKTYDSSCTHVIVSNLSYDDPICAAARKDKKVLVTEAWVADCLDTDTLANVDDVLYMPLKDLDGIPGSEDLCICLTGYQGRARQRIMRMVDLIGARFTKPLLGNIVTHLICYKFEGEKYELAKKTGLELVNHLWLEDCLKSWSLAPEDDYYRSGWEVDERRTIGAICEDKTVASPTQKRDQKRVSSDAKTIANYQVEILEKRRLSGTFGNGDGKLRSPSENKSGPRYAPVSSPPSASKRGEQQNNGRSRALEEEMLHREHQFSSRRESFTGVAPLWPAEAPEQRIAMTPVAGRGSTASLDGNGGVTVKHNDATLPLEARECPNFRGGFNNLNTPNRKQERMTTGDVRTEVSNTDMERSCREEAPSLAIDNASTVPSSGRKAPNQHGYLSPTVDKKSRRISQDGTSKSTPNQKAVCSKAAIFAEKMNISPRRGPQSEAEGLDGTVARNDDRVCFQRSGPSGDGRGATEPGRSGFGDCQEQSPLAGKKSRRSSQDGTSKVSSPIVFPSHHGEETNAFAHPSSRRLSGAQEYLNSSRDRGEVIGSPESKRRRSYVSVPELSPGSDKVCSSNFAITAVPPPLSPMIQTELQKEVVSRGENLEGIEEMDVSVPAEFKSEPKDRRVSVGPKREDVRKHNKTVEPQAVEPFQVLSSQKASLGQGDDGIIPKERSKGGSPGRGILISKERTTVNSDRNADKRCERTKVGTAVVSAREDQSTSSSVDIDASRWKKNKISNKKPSLVSTNDKAEQFTPRDCDGNGAPVVTSRTTSSRRETMSVDENQPDKLRSTIDKCSHEQDKENLGSHGKSSLMAHEVKRPRIKGARPSLIRGESHKYFAVGGSSSERNSLHHLIKLLGGKVCKSRYKWKEEVTHVILPSPLRRTEKFLAGAAAGRWILKPEYVIASRDARKFVNEEDFEWFGPGSNDKGTISLEAPRKWRNQFATTGCGAFYGLRVLLLGESSSPPTDTIKRAIQAGGGLIMATAPPYTKHLAEGVDFAIISGTQSRADNMHIQEVLKHGVACVTYDYIVEYICNPSASLDKYTLFKTNSSVKTVHQRLQKNIAQGPSERIEKLRKMALHKLCAPRLKEEDDIACVVCGRTDEEKVMLLCGDDHGRGCGLATHTFCCSPLFWKFLKTTGFVKSALTYKG